jgi:hypothetical protein
VTAATMLRNARRAAERLARIADTKVGELRAEYVEDAAAVAWLIATWHMPGEEAQLALDVAAKARRQLAKGKAS